MAISLSFVDHAVSSTNGTSYTFSGRSLGAAADDRDILVGVIVQYLGAESALTVTVAGVTADNEASGLASPNQDVRARLARARVSTGTTGDIVVSASTTLEACGISIWRATGLGSKFTSTTDGTLSGNELSASLEIPADGVGIGCVGGYNGTAARTWTWTNLTEESGSDETIQASNPFSSHAAASSSTPGVVTVTATASDTQTSGAMALASYSALSPHGFVFGGSAAGAKLMQLGFIG